jgi:mannose-6-phosphate isomerase-like protein (cupin superfamily)
MRIDESMAEHYVWGNNCEGWHFLKSEALSVIKERVPSGASEKRHRHIYSRQFFYILNGEAVIEIEGIRHVISANSGIEVPAGMNHKFRNDSNADVEFLVISSPKSHGDRIDSE